VLACLFEPALEANTPTITPSMRLELF